MSLDATLKLRFPQVLKFFLVTPGKEELSRFHSVHSAVLQNLFLSYR
ncbi:hypothetical protein T01_6493 [Trichinella spiralis]|uniref:Uncharacterized protein n=1 Tax=Trichinella spiralis TaxID=6334 RepID=A0A0V1AQF0_TRISP|nr:hypothetical protein T01_610 [Trichinella spiralis]KRY27030.1 hypothetical protein T01_6493 [Trichinella spiralis]